MTKPITKGKKLQMMLTDKHSQKTGFGKHKYLRSCV
jgi:hypothetical protein